MIRPAGFNLIAAVNAEARRRRYQEVWAGLALLAELLRT